MGCDNNYNSCNPCGNNSINTNIPESIIRLLRYLKDPVLYIDNLYGNFPDGGELGWLSYVVSENKFATWDVEEKKWKYINDGYLKLSELKTIDDNAIVGKGNIDIYTDIPNITNISIDSFNLHLSKNTTSGIFETDKDSIAVIESNNSKEFETTTEHSIFYKNTGDDILLLTYPKEDRYVYFNDSDNLINVQPNQIVKVLIKGIGLKRIIQSFHQSKASYIRKPVFAFTSSTTFSTDYKSQDLSIPFKSNAKILGVLLSNNLGLKSTVKSIIINNNDYSKGEIIPFDLRKGNNTYNGVLKINIPANNSLDSSEYSVIIDAMIDTEKESKSCSVIQGVAPVIFKTDTTVIRFKASEDLPKLINITSSIGSLFTDFEIQSYPDWTSINKETITDRIQAIAITIEENGYTEERTGSIKLYQSVSKKNIEINIIQEKAEIPSLPEYVKGKISSIFHEFSADPAISNSWNTWLTTPHNWNSKDHTDETGEWLFNGINKQTLQTIEIGEHIFTRQNFMFKYRSDKDDGYANVTQTQIDVAFSTTPVKIAETYDQSRYINGAYTVCDGVVYDAVNTGTFYNSSTDRVEIEPFKIPTVGDWVQIMSMADDTSYQGLLQFMGVKPAKVDGSGSIIENGGDEELPYPYDHIWENSTDKWDISGLHLIPSGRRYNAGNEHGAGNFYAYRKSVGLRAANEDGSLSSFLVALNINAGENGEGVALHTQNYGSTYHLASVRLCRRKTPEELGYQLYADSVNDKVIVTKWNDTAPIVNNITLKSMQIGRLRGVCVRYLNEDKTQVLASLSYLQSKVDLTNTGGGRWYGFDNY